jgi:pimeloyl-ACP methyl ester carboxylesterase
MKNLRGYGEKPYSVAVIHGGPGAAGEVAPIARELSKTTGILEPFQTADSVIGQVEELRDMLEKHGRIPIILIGHSWGAWLCLIVAARYPMLVKKLILVGSGSFERKYAENILPERMNRLTEAGRIEALKLMDAFNEPGAQDRNNALAKIGKLFLKADSYSLLAPTDDEGLETSADINRKVMTEAQEMRDSGELLSLAERVACPVVAIHGDCDPHLPEGVQIPLSLFLRDFRFILLKKCGHEPWLEKYARDRFYEVLKEEIS